MRLLLLLMRLRGAVSISARCATRRVQCSADFAFAAADAGTGGLHGYVKGGGMALEELHGYLFIYRGESV